MTTLELDAETLIAIGTLRGPKVNAVTEAIETIRMTSPEFMNSYRIVPLEIESGVASMPLTRDETIMGAVNRAVRAYRTAQTDKPGLKVYGVGLEGGVHVVEIPVEITEANGKIGRTAQAFITGWTAVHHNGITRVGSSGMIPFPMDLYEHMKSTGQELGPIMDQIRNSSDTRSKDGTVGYLTAGILKRTETFRMATILAFTPFFNPGPYELCSSELPIL
ncbi:MAG: hypothetical protein CVV64_00555 [Candidatus Wallbacteria bacterium HGW-Wallbacteria-1]|jgi:inosine/xanthosine triphosphatase|uniref:inosine/xanthosine triphosphatase n=1 Tax=Candidatus Wallbacteria bacterium HGW-Wallbacteria-1 TaxID=2013854 RepID=A0A2N1PUE8_9BACT|nr:MAG: hypothetical protein CVV64_00555 [Candidatus Wallbacteria bacterium HGW-Wallbacteria-1]